MQSIDLPDVTVDLLDRLAQDLHTDRRGAIRRSLLLLEHLLINQQLGGGATVTDAAGAARKLVIAHYSDGTLSTHHDRIVL